MNTQGGEREGGCNSFKAYRHVWGWRGNVGCRVIGLVCWLWWYSTIRSLNGVYLCLQSLFLNTCYQSGSTWSELLHVESTTVLYPMRGRAGGWVGVGVRVARAGQFKRLCDTDLSHERLYTPAALRECGQ